MAVRNLMLDLIGTRAMQPAAPVAPAPVELPPQPPVQRDAEGIVRGVRKGVLIFTGGEFTIQFDQGFIRNHFHEYQVHLENLKKVRQKRFDDRKCAWSLPPADDAAACLNQLVQWGVTPTREAREKLGEVLKKLATDRAAAAAKEEQIVELTIPGADELNKAITNYQRVGVKFMAQVQRSYNGDEMGTGKSLQCLATFELTNAYPAVILCPVKLKRNWLNEVRRWLPHRRASLMPNDCAEITIVGYSEVHNFVNWRIFSSVAKERNEGKKLAAKKWFFPDFVRIKGIAADEAHWIKVQTSRRSLCAIAIAHACDAQIRMALSGTPIENCTKELISPLTFLGIMDKFGGWQGFVRRYCGAVRRQVGKKANGDPKYAWDVSGATNTRELYEKLQQVCYIRRKKADVIKSLPDKIEAVYEVDISNADEYRRIERDVVSYMLDTHGRLLSREAVDAKHLLKLNALRQAVGRGKVQWIVEWVEEFLESGEKFVLYAYHQQVLDALVRGLSHRNPATVLGGCKDVQREVDKFAKDSTCRVFIGSITAAGFGLNGLQGVASHIGICELMWTHSKHQQAVDRLHRMGQRDCVNAYYFIAPDTIDEDVWAIVSEKARIVASTVDGEEVTQAQALVNLARKLRTRNET